MRHHQRPGGERHELPGDQKAEGVISHHDEVHRGKVRGIERQHALWRFLMTAVAEREQARCRAAEIDNDQEESGECIDAEMRTEPRQTKR
jgi:hypothetical protein